MVEGNPSEAEVRQAIVDMAKSLGRITRQLDQLTGSRVAMSGAEPWQAEVARKVAEIQSTERRNIARQIDRRIRSAPPEIKAFFELIRPDLERGLLNEY